MSKGEETRATVLTAALAMASEDGLLGLSLGKLADQVGMSKSGLFAHFSSKENLQVQILDEAAARFVSLVVAPALKEPRGEPRVRALFERWLSWKDAPFMPGGCVFVTAAVELDDKPGPARDRLVATQRDWLDTLATAARIAVREGHFRRSLDPLQFAHDFYSLAYGHHFVSRLLEDPDALARTRASFERLLRDARAAS
jgi:AcrR family transcriptional regulator